MANFRTFAKYSKNSPIPYNLLLKRRVTEDIFTNFSKLFRKNIYEKLERSMCAELAAESQNERKIYKFEANQKIQPNCVRLARIFRITIHEFIQYFWD